MPEVNRQELLKFIAKAHRHTYAAPKEVRQKYRCDVPILPGHKDYHFTDGDWGYHDSYTGKEGAPGREVVFFQGEPVWCMAYQGKATFNEGGNYQGNPSVDETRKVISSAVSTVLKEALMNMTDDMPFRGPAEYRLEDYIYTFELTGDYRYFTGKEAISLDGNELFFQDVMGKLI